MLPSSPLFWTPYLSKKLTINADVNPMKHNEAPGKTKPFFSLIKFTKTSIPGKTYISDTPPKCEEFHNKCDKAHLPIMSKLIHEQQQS